MMSYSRIKGVFFRYFYTMIKGLHQLSDLFYWPLVDLLMWGLTSVWIQQQNNVPSLPLILMTGLIFWQIAWRGSIDISFNLLQELWHRNLMNLFSTPMKVSEWITAVLLISVCKLGLSISFGTLMVYLLYSLNVYTIGWLFLPFAALLFVFGWSLGFFSSGLILYFGHRIEMFVWMIAFIFAPFSAVFYPVAVLPTWAQYISWSLPTAYIFEGMREVLKGNSIPLDYLWISLALNILFLSASIAFFIWMLKKSRIKGLGRLE